jgi:hypothetical protein
MSLSPYKVTKKIRDYQMFCQEKYAMSQSIPNNPALSRDKAGLFGNNGRLISENGWLNFAAMRRSGN